MNIEELLKEEGWHPTEEMPSNNRPVSVVLAGNLGVVLNGFADVQGLFPPTRERIWWCIDYANYDFPLPCHEVVAWHEFPAVIKMTNW